MLHIDGDRRLVCTSLAYISVVNIDRVPNRQYLVIQIATDKSLFLQSL